MITIGYPPAQVGGTEIYVHSLISALKKKGHRCSVAYIDSFTDENEPQLYFERRVYEGANVYAIKVNAAKLKLEFIIFDEHLRSLLLSEFRRVVDEVNPDIIHVHPLQLGFDSYLIEEMSRAGEHVVFTYHSTTTTCARGDLIHMGREVCDGLVLQKRCTKCLYHWKSVPAPLAMPLSRLPLRWSCIAHARLARYDSLRKLRSLVSIPLIIQERREAWTRATEHASAVVAVCDWVREIIVKNGVAPAKVIFSRHGLRLDGRPNGNSPQGKTRFGYLGRISPEKGIGLLVDVLSDMPPELAYDFEFCSASMGNTHPARKEEAALLAKIYELQEKDRRVKVLDKVGDENLRNVLANWDAMVVPSLWLESGPQVIYEAFAVRTPIIGSRLGGIAELVRDGETGFLFTRNSAVELATLLAHFSKQPSLLRALRANIPPVRTTSDVADDMLNVYEQLLSQEPTSIARRAAF